MCTQIYSEVISVTKECKKGDWVEIHYIVLEARERTGDIPEDTQKVPLECWIKGWAVEEGSLGEKITIETPAHRHVEGTLTRINPEYTHTFGPYARELSTIGKELRKALKEGN